MTQQDPILLMSKRVSILLGVSESQLAGLVRERTIPYVRVERGTTTLFPIQYIMGLQRFAQLHDYEQVTRELARSFGRTQFAFQLQGFLRHLFWELFRDVDSFDIQFVEALFGLTTTPGARIIRRWQKKGVFSLHEGRIPASQLSAACEWWDMDYS